MDEPVAAHGTAMDFDTLPGRDASSPTEAPRIHKLGTALTAVHGGLDPAVTRFRSIWLNWIQRWRHLIWSL